MVCGDAPRKTQELQARTLQEVQILNLSCSLFQERSILGFAFWKLGKHDPLGLFFHEQKPRKMTQEPPQKYLLIGKKGTRTSSRPPQKKFELSSHGNKTIQTKTYQLTQHITITSPFFSRPSKKPTNKTHPKNTLF